MDHKSQFLANPTINPETNRHIKIGGAVYKKLVQKYGHPILPSEQEFREKFQQDPTVNPETNRRISTNGAVYSKLVAKYGLKMCECCVCYDENVPVNKKTKCGHSICLNCTLKLEKSSCPICRTSPIVSDYNEKRPNPVRTSSLSNNLIRILVYRYGVSETSLSELIRDGMPIQEIVRLFN